MAHIQEEHSKLWHPQSTHETVDSQKMFVDNIVQMEANHKDFVDHSKTHNIKTYTDLSQIGLTIGSETIEGIVTAMPTNSKLQIQVTSANNASIYPHGFGMLIVEKAGNYRIKFEFYYSDQAIGWFGIYDIGGSVWSGWSKINDGGNAAKVGGYTIMNETHLTTQISDCATINDLISQMPEKSVLYGYTWNVPSWFPSGVSTDTWMLKVIKHSKDAIFFELDNGARADRHYKAGHSYGNIFTGWDRMGVTDIVVAATVVE